MSANAENIEGNVEAPLLGEDLDSFTLPWEHDNALIRLPAQFIRWLIAVIPRNISKVWMVLLGFIIIVAGIILAISVSRGQLPILLLVLVAGAGIALAIVGGVSRERR